MSRPRSLTRAPASVLFFVRNLFRRSGAVLVGAAKLSGRCAMGLVRWRKIVTLCAGAALVVAVGSGVASPAQTPDTLVVAQSADPDTADPHKSTGTATMNVLINLYDTLVRRDADLKLHPGLALSWRMVDPTTWEFKLRQGVKFHDGEPFNAQAVKF